MKNFLAVGFSLFLPFLLQAAPDSISAEKAIQAKGSITISDGSSFYTFREDGSFQSGPRGLSGRVITGKWKIRNDRPMSIFIVDGEWSWMNGSSLNDDFGRIVFDIRPGVFRKTSAEERQFTLSGEVFECYFLIDELNHKAK